MLGSSCVGSFQCQSSRNGGGKFPGQTLPVPQGGHASIRGCSRSSSKPRCRSARRVRSPADRRGSAIGRRPGRRQDGPVQCAPPGEGRHLAFAAGRWVAERFRRSFSARRVVVKANVVRLNPQQRGGRARKMRGTMKQGLGCPLFRTGRGRPVRWTGQGLFGSRDPGRRQGLDGARPRRSPSVSLHRRARGCSRNGRSPRLPRPHAPNEVVSSTSPATISPLASATVRASWLPGNWATRARSRSTKLQNEVEAERLTRLDKCS